MNIDPDGRHIQLILAKSDGMTIYEKKQVKYLPKSLWRDALNMFVRTPRGRAFFAAFAKRGDNVAGIVFEEDGKLSNHTLCVMIIDHMANKGASYWLDAYESHPSGESMPISMEEAIKESKPAGGRVVVRLNGERALPENQAIPDESLPKEHHAGKDRETQKFDLLGFLIHEFTVHGAYAIPIIQALDQRDFKRLKKLYDDDRKRDGNDGETSHKALARGKSKEFNEHAKEVRDLLIREFGMSKHQAAEYIRIMAMRHLKLMQSNEGQGKPVESTPLSPP